MAVVAVNIINIHRIIDAITAGHWFVNWLQFQTVSLPEIMNIDFI